MVSPWYRPDPRDPKPEQDADPPPLIQTGYSIFYADGRVIYGQCKLPERPGYVALQQLLQPILDGALPERVNVWHDGKYTDMFVDEIGMLKGLDRNEAATAIYRANVLEHEDSPPAPEDMPAIYGTAVLFARKVWS